MSLAPPATPVRRSARPLTSKPSSSLSRPSAARMVACRSRNWMRAFDGHQADLVGGADALAGLHAAAGHPDGEAGGVVLAAIVALHHRRAAKFAGPDDERRVEQAALFQVRRAARRSAGRSSGRAACGCRSACRARPSRPCPACRRAARSARRARRAGGRAGICGRSSRCACLRARSRSSARRFARLAVHVADFQRRGLHAVGEFVAGDARVEFA